MGQNRKQEMVFENELAKVSAICHGAYFKIPDAKITKERITLAKKCKNYGFNEYKRPFDGVLCLPNGNFCIECKYNYNTLEAHQKENLEKVGRINDMGYVLRKMERFDSTGIRRTSLRYRVEKNGEVLLETDNPIDLIKYFSGKEAV